jgi:hypothetical protein
MGGTSTSISRRALTRRVITSLTTSAVLGVALVIGPLAEATQARAGAARPPALLSNCSLFASVYVYADTPRLEHPRVWMTGGIEYRSARYCFPDRSGVYAQTKACGVFGCNWQTRDAMEYTPYYGMHETPGMDCRQGTHRYRTRTVFGYRVPDEHGLVPGYPVIADSAIQPEFSCK